MNNNDSPTFPLWSTVFPKDNDLSLYEISTRLKETMHYGRTKDDLCSCGMSAKAMHGCISQDFPPKILRVY